MGLTFIFWIEFFCHTILVIRNIGGKYLCCAGEGSQRVIQFLFKACHC